MKTVNLLPPWYLSQRRQRRNLRLHMGIMLALGFAMVGIVLVESHQKTALAARLVSLQNHLAQMKDPAPELQKQTAKLHTLEDLKLACNELGIPVPMSAVIQQVQNHLSPGMALAQIVVDVRPDPVKGTGLIGDSRNPPKYHDVAHLNVVGISPNDAQITQFIGALSENRLFSDVTLNYMKAAIVKGYMAREFEIQLEMDLEPLASTDPLADADSTPLSNAPPAPGAADHAR